MIFPGIFCAKPSLYVFQASTFAHATNRNDRSFWIEPKVMTIFFVTSEGTAYVDSIKAQRSLCMVLIGKDIVNDSKLCEQQN